jgi:protein phosphatase 1 regulatory subunit 7
LSTFYPSLYSFFHSLYCHIPAYLEMSEQNAAPRSELDPTKTDANGASEAHDQDKDDHKPRDSKGWDGKLRVDKLALSDEPRDPNVKIESDPEESEDEGPPPDQIEADEDLLDDMPDDEDEIELVHCKISDLASLRLERFRQMKVHQPAFQPRPPLLMFASASACDRIA